MRKIKILAVLLACLSVFAAACGGEKHKHDYSCQVKGEEYLKIEASCQTSSVYYYSCKCGKKGEKAFAVGSRLPHNYTAKVMEEKYVKTPGNCQTVAEYYLSCTMCGKKSYGTFKAEGFGDHTYVKEIPDGKYIKSEATKTESAVYYKSCVCGLYGEETFSYGNPLRDYTENEKLSYKPTSLTVSLYDTETSTYGFTYNTQSRPLRPVIQVAKGETLENYQEYSAFIEEATSYAPGGSPITYYIVKAEIPLDKNATYTYKAYDKYVDVGTELSTLQTKDLSATSFTFAHVSDSQSSENTGEAFGKVLANIVGKNDFILHTGDVVEDSKLEDEWKNMLDSNFTYLSKIPMMAISGNHETTYKHGSNETYKHFHNKIPAQPTELGYYYSFIYGNAKFIMLNTNRLTDKEALTDDQYTWLVNELESNTAQWTFVAMHNPMYSPGNYGSDPGKNSISVALRAQLQSIFAQYGVDVVLQGHDHVVSTTHPIDGEGNALSDVWQNKGGVQYAEDPNGVIYVLNGPAGTQVREPNAHMNAAFYHYAKPSFSRSWAEFTVQGNILTVNVRYSDSGEAGAYKNTTWGIIKSA